MSSLLKALWDRLHGSLRARLVIPTAILFTATLTAMVFAAVQIYTAGMEKEIRERAMLFASLAASSIAKHEIKVGDRDLAVLFDALQKHRAGIESVSILSPEGTVITSSEPRLVGSMPWELDQLDLSRPIAIPRERNYAVLKPLVNEEACASCHGQTGKVLGVLDLRFSTASLLAAQRHLTSTLVLTAVPSLLLLLAVSWFLLGREAIHPIQRLVRAMRKAESGDDQAQADEGRADEIGLAARGFDSTLTALRKSQGDLQRAYEERMVRADRFAMIGQMATGLAHEIKNPLAGLSGALELMAEDLAGSPQSEVIAEMQHQVVRLEQIMEGLLSFARPPRAHLQNTDVNVALEKVLFLVSQQRRGATIEVQRDLAPSLPPVRADPAQLEQVFLNICLNAFQAVNGHGGTIRVCSFARDTQVFVEFHDSGPGIPPDVRPHIFTPFFTTRSNGTGLGLAICLRLLSENGGKIHFNCPSSGGTVFVLSLPTEEASRLATPTSTHT